MCVEDRELRNTVHNDIEDWEEPYLFLSMDSVYISPIQNIVKLIRYEGYAH